MQRATINIMKPQMNWNSPINLLRGIAALAISLLALPLAAQEGLENLVFTMGTPTVDGNGRHWAYVLWQGTQPTLIKDRTYAIYVKTGAANSPNPFERKSIVALQSDPIVLEPLVNRAIHLGQNPTELELSIDHLFEEVIPAETLTLPQKLSAIIQSAMEEPRHFENLLLLSRLHPAVSFCLGIAHAEQIPGPAGTKTTLEVRVFDKAKQQDLAVVGRVTVTAGEPVILPAPGAPVELPDPSPKGDLNAKLRWSAPDPLRRLGLLQYGYNVFRMTRQFAEDNGFDVAPPDPATLQVLVDSNDEVHRLNYLPILPPRDFSALDVVDFVADPETFFMSDANDRFNPNTVLPQDIFFNGAQFYYFATARDILGRNGLVSPGTLVTICDRMPPGTPRNVQVVNDYIYAGGAPDQRLKVIWEQNVDSENEETVSYYIYRWSSLNEMHALSGNPALNLVAGPIAHVPGQQKNEYRDDGAGAPHISTDAGRTIWYTVRAIDAGACGPNFGPNSAPKYGVLRDRVGPGKGGGRVEIDCPTPTVVFRPGGTNIPQTGLDTNFHHFRVNATARNADILWAEFYRMIRGGRIGPDRPLLLGRVYFGEGDTEVGLDHQILLPEVNPNELPEFLCLVGASNGKISSFASGVAPLPVSNRSVMHVYFDAQISTNSTAPRGPCDEHDPNPPGNEGGEVTGIDITVFLTPGTKEWKVYRRVDDGPLTLVCQGEGDFEAGDFFATCTDDAMPANAAKLCYYSQLFDEHGNAGPLERIDCVFTLGATSRPTPVLTPLTSEGDFEDARMNIQWFCPPYGVERFEIWMAQSPGVAPEEMAGEMVWDGNPLNDLAINQGGEDVDHSFRVFRTKKIGPGFGNGALFQVVAKVETGKTYTVFVKAVTPGGAVSKPSNVESFTWGVAGITGPDVTWPDRPLPGVNESDFPGVEPRVFTMDDPLMFNNTPFEGVAVKIGHYTGGSTLLGVTNSRDTVLGFFDPMEAVFRDPGDRSLFPVAMYRYQVPNAAYPEVSGDVIQVTPLMEQIAYQHVATQSGPATKIHDPFVRLVPTEPTITPDNDLWLLDTQPLTLGARYKYVLVRFDEQTREIADVIPTGEIEVTQ